MFPIKRGTKQGDLLSSLLKNKELQFSLEEDLKRRQEKRTGIGLSDKKDDCLTNLRFADDVLLLSTSLNKLEDMLCDFKRSTESVGLGTHPSETKILSNQVKVKKNEVTMDNIKKEVLATSDSARHLGQKFTFDEQNNSRSQKQTKSSMGSIPQISQRIYFESISPVPQITLFQHGDHADGDLRKWNVDTVFRNMK